MKIREYVEEVFQNVPESDEKRSLLNELILDAEEKAADLMAGGKTEEDAVNKALVELGDLSEIKLGLMNVAAPHGVPRRDRNNLLYSVFGSAMIIALMLFINLYYSPWTIWFVYPMFAILWWPLTMLLHYMNRREGSRK